MGRRGGKKWSPSRPSYTTRTQVSQPMFETPLNMMEVKSVELNIDDYYDERSTRMEFNAGNVAWTWTSEQMRGGGYRCFLQFDTATNSTIWKTTIHLSIFFKSSSNVVQKEILVRDQVFDHTHKKWGTDLSPEEWKSVMKQEEGNTKNPTIEIQICVSKIVGFRNRAKVALDFSVFRPDSDLLFTFGDKRVFIDVGYLAILSPYFAATRERMEHMPKDAITNVAYEEMIDVDHDNFVELMQVVYPSRKKITDANVECLVVLADRFLFNNVLVDVEQFLIENIGTPHPNIDVFTKLQWAYTYSMADLQDKCISELKTFESINAVFKSPVYDTLPVEIVKSLFERMALLQKRW